MVRLPHGWENDPVEHLVRVKFPFENSYKNSFPSLSSKVSYQRNEQYLKEASEYRAELKQLPRAELLAMAEEAFKVSCEKARLDAEAREANLFFNRPTSTADFAYWARMSTWSIDEATALSFGKEPRQVNWDNLKGHVNVSEFAAKYQAQRELFNRARLAGQLWSSTFPGVFLAWAARMQVKMPAALIVEVEKLGVQIADWKTVSDLQTVRIAELEKALAELKAAPMPVAENLETPKEKGLTTRERNSLLTLVIGMAIAGYGYDPSKSRTNTAKEISDDLLRKGLSLSDDTIRAYLQEARELLPPIETEHKH